MQKHKQLNSQSNTQSDSPTLAAPNIAIIGAGIAGCSTAYLLAKAGFKISVFEQANGIAQGGSGNAAAMLYPRLNGDNIASRFAHQAYQFSLGFYQSLGLRDSSFNQCGLLQLAFNTQEKQRIQKAAKHFSLGKLVDANTASALSGILCNYDALHLRDAAWLVPQQACQQLLNQPNITLHTNAKVNQIQLSNTGAHLIVGQQALGEFQHLIHCSAFEALQFNQTQHLALKTTRGQVSLLTANQASSKLKTIICSDGYLSPAINGLHHLGASFKPNSRDLAESKKEHAENLQKLDHLAPQLGFEDHDITSGRVGLRCVSKDRLPLVGGVLNTSQLEAPLPRAGLTSNTLAWCNGLWTNLAHGSHGFIFAPYCAHLLTQLITEQYNEATLSALAHLNPNRFLLRELGLKRLAKTAAAPQLTDLHFAKTSDLS